MKSSSLTIQASLIIPLFNNQHTELSQLRRCEDIMKKSCREFEIIVCDDKSTDSSASILKKNYSDNSKFKLIFHSKNLGIGKTIRSLYEKARYEYVVLFSVDGDWNPNDIGKLLNFAKKTHADIVIGRRTYKNYSSYRRIISFFYNFLPYLFFQTKTIDAGSIKVIRRDIIRSTPIISKSVFSDAEMIIRATKKSQKVLSLPISFKRKTGKGSGGKIKLVILSFIDLINLRLKI